MTLRRHFGPTASSVGASRHFVSDATSDLSADIQESATLMVSELATNALVHATTGFTVSVERAETRLRIEVTDAGDGRPVVRSPQPSEPHGRGLRIVIELAADWGVTQIDDGDGKSVWFTMRLSSEHFAFSESSSSAAPSP
jgi:serine/threonine-protein kinase RsbW